MLKIWDLRKGTNFAAIEAHSNKVNSVKFYNDYKGLVTCGDDLGVRFWNINLPKLNKLDNRADRESSVSYNMGSEMQISESQKLDLETQKAEKMPRVDLPVDGNLEKAFDQIIEQLNKLNLTVRLMDQRLVDNEKEVLQLTKFVTRDIEENN